MPELQELRLGIGRSAPIGRRADRVLGQELGRLGSLLAQRNRRALGVAERDIHVLISLVAGVETGPRCLRTALQRGDAGLIGSLADDLDFAIQTGGREGGRYAVGEWAVVEHEIVRRRVRPER